MGLFDLLKKLPTLNEITGSFGEQLAKFYAKTIPGAIVMHDVLIDGAAEHTSQIDLLIIGTKGIYVVEVKTFTDAKIYGDMAKSKWYYYSHGRKYEIYSPIKQNQKHVDYLKRFLQDFGDIPFFSIITMICEDYKLSGASPQNTIVCNSLPAMERAMYQLTKEHPAVLSEEEKQKICAYIQTNQHIGKSARAAHKEQVVSYKNDLEELKSQKKCPYCKADLVLRNGKYGSFYGCPNYPKCKYILK